MKTKMQSCAWLIRNKINSTILLPEPPISPHDLEILPIDGTAIVTEKLRRALDGLVDVVQEIPTHHHPLTVSELLIDPEPKTECRYDQTISIKHQNDVITANLEAFLKAWEEHYGEYPVRSSELHPLAKNLLPSLKADFSISNHKAYIALGRWLTFLSQQNLEAWSIETIRKNKKSCYLLRKSLPMMS